MPCPTCGDERYHPDVMRRLDTLEMNEQGVTEDTLSLRREISMIWERIINLEDSHRFGVFTPHDD